jgi:antitoxin PrlF
MSAVTSKGQVTIPKRIREAMGIKPGSKVAFEYQGEGKATVYRAGKTPTERFSKLRGRLKGGPSTDEIMALLRGD